MNNNVSENADCSDSASDDSDVTYNFRSATLNTQVQECVAALKLAEQPEMILGFLKVCGQSLWTESAEICFRKQLRIWCLSI
jgi:hypothetical protein